MLSHGGVTVCQEQSSHGDTILEALQVTAAVEGLQSVGGVVLVRAKEGLETEFVGVGALKQGLDEVKVILLEQLRLVVLVFHQVTHLLFQVMEVDRVLVDVLQEELVRSLAILIELNLSILVIEIEQCIQRVVIQLFFWLYWFGYGLAQLRGHG